MNSSERQIRARHLRTTARMHPRGLPGLTVSVISTSRISDRLTSVEIWVTRAAFVRFVRALPVRLTPRLYIELVSAARARRPVVMERQKNCTSMRHQRVMTGGRPRRPGREISSGGTDLVLAHTRRHRRAQKPDGHADATTYVWDLRACRLRCCTLLAEIDDCLT